MSTENLKHQPKDVNKYELVIESLSLLALNLYMLANHNEWIDQLIKHQRVPSELSDSLILSSIVLIETLRNLGGYGRPFDIPDITIDINQLPPELRT